MNLTLKLGGLTESVDVISSASTIDLTSPSTETTISQDLLGSMPLNIGTVQLRDGAAELLAGHQ